MAFPLLTISQTLNHQNAISGGAERHLQFKAADTPNDVMEIGNSTSQNNQFQPVDDYFNLYFERADHSSMTVRVYDASGKILLTKSEIPQNEKIILNVSNFSSGVYYYELSSVGKSPLKKGMFIKN